MDGENDSGPSRRVKDLRASYYIPKENIEDFKEDLKNKLKQWCYTPITVLGKEYKHQTWGENAQNPGWWYLCGNPWAKSKDSIWVGCDLKNGTYPARANVKVISQSGKKTQEYQELLGELFQELVVVCDKYGTHTNEG